MKTTCFALDDLDVGERARPLNAGHVKRLAESIGQLGLQTPITVRRVPDPEFDMRIMVVAGVHRFEAAKSLGWAHIECFVSDGSVDDAELWEIDENFARAELTDAQRADHHARRAAILIRRGEVRAAPGRPRNGDKLSSYADQASASLGVDKRTVQRDLRRGKEIDADVLADVSGSDLDKGVVLDELASTPREEQRAKLTEISERRSMVRPAADPLNDPEAHEKQLAALMSAWNRAAAVVREEFMQRIDEPVFDKTKAA